MENQYTAESLHEMIKVLEIKQDSEGELLKNQLLITYESLKPSNILKNVVKEFYSSENLKDELITTAISVTSGFISKKIIIGKSNNQVLKLLGLAVQLGITTLVNRKIEVLKDAAMQFVNRFLERNVNKEDVSDTVNQ